MIAEINELLKNIPKLKNTAKYVNENVEKFAYKADDRKNKKWILNYKDDDKQTHDGLLKALKKDNAVASIDEKTIAVQIINKKQFVFRKTGKAIASYWGNKIGASQAEQTNYQEVGVFVWVSILAKGGKTLKDFNPKTKVFTDSPDTLSKTIEFLEKESLKSNGWDVQCKKAAEGILSKLPKLKDPKYEYHQGGSLFNKLRSKGQSLSGIPGAADKWNPSDIYFIKSFKESDLNQFKNIESLNSFLEKFDKIIGVSLKGEAAGHGAISLKNIFKFLKMNEPAFSKWTIKNKRLDNNQIDQYKKLLKNIKDVAAKCPFPGGVILYLGNKIKYNLTTSITEMAGKMEIDSDNWGASIPVTLAFLAELKTEELWNRFAFYAFSLAASQVDRSASYYKAEGNGTCKLIESGGLDKSKFECIRCRIPLSGETNIIFDAKYDGVSQKMQFRSKGNGTPPQMTIWHVSESVSNFKDISQFKF